MESRQTYGAPHAGARPKPKKRRGRAPCATKAKREQGFRAFAEAPALHACAKKEQERNSVIVMYNNEHKRTRAEKVAASNSQGHDTRRGTCLPEQHNPCATGERGAKEKGQGRQKRGDIRPQWGKKQPRGRGENYTAEQDQPLLAAQDSRAHFAFLDCAAAAAALLRAWASLPRL